MEIKSIRPTLAFGLLISLTVIGVALTLHYYFELTACSLCMVETVLFVILSASLLIAFLHNPTSWGRRIYGILFASISLTGALVAGRHAWLEHLPKNGTQECKPLIETWINDLPITEVIQNLITVSDGCSKISFSFLSFSIPELTTIIFSIFLFYSLKLLLLAR